MTRHRRDVVAVGACDALNPGMPRAAMRRVTPDQVVPAGELGGVLAELTRADLPEAGPMPVDAMLDAEEKTVPSRRMADTRLARHVASTARFRQMARDAESAGAAIRRLSADIGGTGVDDDTSRPPERQRGAG